MSLRKRCRTTQLISDSAINSFEEYQEQSEYETWLGNIPEFWFSVKIYEALSEMKGRRPILENSVDDIREWSERRRPGRVSSDIRKNGRTDIQRRGHGLQWRCICCHC